MKPVHNPFLFCGILIGTLLLVFSCQKKPTRLKEQAHFDSIMNADPKQALLELQGMKAGAYRNAPEAERMKLELMIAKAGDKAFIPKTSDSVTQRLVDYYENHGTRNELMEAYFYHGSAYRDLHDSPKALKYYQKALDVTDTCATDFDWYQYSVLLEQMAGLYNLQNDNLQAIKYHKEILRITRQQSATTPHDILMLGRYYYCADSLQKAFEYYGYALKEIERTGVKGINDKKLSAIGELLSFYSMHKQYESAERCYQILKKYKLHELPFNTRAAVGDYMMAHGKYEKALKILTSADTCHTDEIEIIQKVSSKFTLYKLQRILGNDKKALLYADEYILYSDSLTKIQNSEQAKQINNAYKYYKSAQHELQLEKKAENFYRYGLIAMVITVLVFCIVYMAYRYSNRRRDRKIAIQNTTISNQKAAITEKDNTIGLLETKNQETAQRLQQVERELTFRKETALSVSDVRALFTNGDGGKRLCPVNDMAIWQQLFASVDGAFPDFANRISAAFTDLDIMDKKILYLMKIGMKNRETADILKRSPSAVSQHCSKMKETCGMEIKDFIA